jgi:hypothetical protein
MRRVRHVRRAALACAVVGLACLTGGRVYADNASGGSAIGGFALGARAPGFEGTYDTPNAQFHPYGQGAVPSTQVSLNTGPVGFAQAAIVWPGTAVGNLGDTLILGSGGQAPPSSRALNDPVRAEARSPQGPGDSTYQQGSVSMTAHADAAKSDALATVKHAELPGGTVGNVTSMSTSILGSALATSTATSKASDVDFAKGVLHIDSITSIASATTDGVKAAGEGHTTVSGAKIAGQPATIDENGVHFSSSSASDAVVNQVAQQALARSGLTIYVTKPDKQESGASGTYTSGSVLVTYHVQDQFFTITFGGASASVNAAPAFDAGALADLGGAPVTPALAGASPASASSPASSPSLASAEPAGGSGASAPVGSAVAASTTPIGYFHGVAPIVGVLGLAAAGALAVAGRRLPDRILEDTPTTTCNLESEG